MGWFEVQGPPTQPMQPHGLGAGGLALLRLDKMLTAYFRGRGRAAEVSGGDKAVPSPPAHSRPMPLSYLLSPLGRVSFDSYIGPHDSDDLWPSPGLRNVIGCFLKDLNQTCFKSSPIFAWMHNYVIPLNFNLITQVYVVLKYVVFLNFNFITKV